MQRESSQDSHADPGRPASRGRRRNQSARARRQPIEEPGHELPEPGMSWYRPETSGAGRTGEPAPTARASELAQALSVAASRDEENRRLRGEREERDAALARACHEREELRKRLRDVEFDLASRQARIGELEGALAAQGQQRSRLEEEIARSEERTERAEQRAAERERELDAARERHAAALDAQARWAEESAALRERVQGLEQRVCEHEADCSAKAISEDAPRAGGVTPAAPEVAIAPPPARLGADAAVAPPAAPNGSEARAEATVDPIPDAAPSAGEVSPLTLSALERQGTPADPELGALREAVDEAARGGRRRSRGGRSRRGWLRKREPFAPTDANVPPIFLYWRDRQLRTKLAHLAVRGYDDWFAFHLARACAELPDRTVEVLSLAGPDAELEARVAARALERGAPNFRVACLDADEERVARRLAAAQTRGVAGHLAVLDPTLLAGRSYDVALADEGLGAVLADEVRAAAVRDALFPQATLVVGDRIAAAPDASPAAAALFAEANRMLPARLRAEEDTGEALAANPEDGVVLRHLADELHPETFAAFGHLSDAFLGSGRGERFDAEAPADRRVADALAGLDDAKIDAGVLAPRAFVGAFRAQPSAHPFVWQGRGPAECLGGR